MFTVFVIYQNKVQYLANTSIFTVYLQHIFRLCSDYLTSSFSTGFFLFLGNVLVFYFPDFGNNVGELDFDR